MMRKSFAIAAAASSLALGAAACGSQDSSGSRSGASATPKPVAEISQLTGRSTGVTLDSGFVGALKVAQAHTHAGRQGDALQGRRRELPDHRRQRDKPGSVSPYVEGTIDHAGKASA
jgi:hypothetical protein